MCVRSQCIVLQGSVGSPFCRSLCERLPASTTIRLDTQLRSDPLLFRSLFPNAADVKCTARKGGANYPLSRHVNVACDSAVVDQMIMVSIVHSVIQ